MEPLLRFAPSVEHDPAIDAWFERRPADLAAIASDWFQLMRQVGTRVGELMHDGCPNLCVQDAPFAYINAFTAHVNIGFFHGAALPDPEGLLQGAGKEMRHVKLKPGEPVNRAAVQALVQAAYRDILLRLGLSD
ncbi:DUF1801 domain-containing protein [Paucibacter sp. JuS9]|uniref:DUF1801 domain-containing protein n=1 Tax=Roseateles TaxID=93681 RepID=UPI002FE67938